MMDKIIVKEGLLAKMEKEDKNSLTPLFTVNSNPYGDINFDFSKPSFLLEVA
jgi:hypothetical protein